MSEKIGRKIKGLRELNGISLDELAERASVKKEQLEMVENEQVDPSMGMLTKITRVLGVRLGTILDGGEDSGIAVSTVADRTKTIRFSSNEETLNEQLDYVSLAKGKTDRHMEPFIVTINPGDDKQTKLSRHEGEEFIYVLEGELSLVYGKDNFSLKAGDSVYYNSIIPHYVSAKDKPARILAVVYVPI